MTKSAPNFEAVERALRRRTFGTLSTVTADGRPHASGVVYAVSPPGEPLCLYVTTNAKNKKIANVRANAGVAFVVPLLRPVITAFPPACLQFQGTAEFLDATDEGALAAFGSTWFGRTILKTEHHIVAEGGRLCFIRIRPDPVIFTYGFGMSLLTLRRQAGKGAARVSVPAERRAA
jgi:nitroimidazol reductase NimA-like FMN-containing flavoprotein (pyridoxamine 5'-phosphate oxidase superfamily)